MSIVRTRDRKYLQVGKAAEELGLHPITIRRWMNLGKLAAVRVAIEARIPRSEIEDGSGAFPSPSGMG